MDRLDRRDKRTGMAQRLRRDATPAEKALWQQLRLVDVRGHFRRQVPLGPYFADFAHLGLRLVVELDGDQHGQEAGLRHDALRTAWLEHAGFQVLRFWNHEVHDNPDGVTETILAALSTRGSPGSAPTATRAEATV